MMMMMIIHRNILPFFMGVMKGNNVQYKQQTMLATEQKMTVHV
jgi:hypothetical protein